MATTTTVQGISIRKGPHVLGGEQYALEVTVNVTGTYLTASKPNFDILAALEAVKHQGISAVKINFAAVFQDYNDGTNRYTGFSLTLSSTGNKVLTFGVGTTDATHTNGTQLAEIADATALNGQFSFLLVGTITGYGL